MCLCASVSIYLHAKALGSGFVGGEPAQKGSPSEGAEVHREVRTRQNVHHVRGIAAEVEVRLDVVRNPVIGSKRARAVNGLSKQRRLGLGLGGRRRAPHLFQQLHVLLYIGMEPLRDRIGIRRDHDAGHPRQRLLSAGQPLPELLGDEGHHGMDQAQELLQNHEESQPRDLPAGQAERVLVCEHGLEQLQEQVAGVVEQEGVQRRGGGSELVTGDGRVAILRGHVEAREDEKVALGDGRVAGYVQVTGRVGGEGWIRQVREGEPKRIPDLIADE